MRNFRRAQQLVKHNDEVLFKQANEEWEKGRLRSAYRLFLAGAKAGDPGAQANLGYFFDIGIGMKPSRRRALYWYRRAFKQGYSAGATNIGTIYRDKGELRKALMWFQRAVKLGDADANLEIAKIYLREKKVFRKAIPYLLRTIKAASGTEVTEDSRQEARRLLERYKRK